MTFLAGQILTADDVNAHFGTSMQSVQNTVGTTTSSSYTATLSGGIACSGVIVAPASGKIEILNSTQISVVTAGNGFCTTQVRAGAVVGSGSIVMAAADENACVQNVSSLTRFSVVTTLPGLTPGASYNIQQLFKSDAGNTASFTRKRLDVKGVA